MRTLALFAAIASGMWSCLPAVAAAPASYSAVAVQYTPLGDYSTPPWQSLSSNIDALAPILDQARKYGAMVAVVPEGALGMFTAENVNTRDAMLPYCTTVGEVGSNPCEEMGPAGPGNSTLYQLWRASCLARESELTLVLNLCETRACYANESSICPSDGRWQWNTELAFSPLGALQMKYHKAHLFGGSGVFDQALPVPTTFETGGGFVFGSFICFDLMFAHPALDLVAAGIKDVVFSSWWVNAVPSFDAIMAQQAWSRVNKVNLIAANTGANPANAGGGIYASGEPINAFFDTSADAAGGVTEILFATLPINSAETDDTSDVETVDEPQLAAAPSALLTDLTYTPCLPNVVTFDFANCTFFTAADLRARAAALGVPETSSLSIPVSQGNISCVVSLALSASFPANDSEVYAVMALQGVEQFPYTPGALSLQVCALQHCVLTPGLPVCTGMFDAYQTRLDSFSMQMIGMDPAAASFPMLGLDDGQVGSTMLADYKDLNPQTMGGPGERVVQWGSSQRFQNQSIFAAVIYAVRPTATTESEKS